MGCCQSKPPVDFTQDVSFEQFKLLRSVGKGAFGKVCIVMKRDSKKLYAMKYMSKEKCIEKKALSNVINEQKILMMLRHNFIVNLWFAFQDQEDMFMVVDLMLGGDLRFHLMREGGFSQERVRLYVAELACCLDYLHGKRVVHRDIKPDNILLDPEGHAHLADFNVSVILKEGELLRHKAGTRPYMAPELFNKQGYSFPVDYWSLGVTMYEMLKGKHPFRALQGDELVAVIQNGNFKYPSDWSPGCVEVCRGLLQRDPRKRINYQDMQSMAWFADLDWQKVNALEVKPPFTPDKDKINCDAMHELEEMMLEEKPLHKKKKRNRQNGDDDENADGMDEGLRAGLKKCMEEFQVYDRIKAEKDERAQVMPKLEPIPSMIAINDHTKMRKQSSSVTSVREEQLDAASNGGSGSGSGFERRPASKAMSGISGASAIGSLEERGEQHDDGGSGGGADEVMDPADIVIAEKDGRGQPSGSGDSGTTAPTAVAVADDSAAAAASSLAKTSADTDANAAASSATENGVANAEVEAARKRADSDRKGKSPASTTDENQDEDDDGHLQVESEAL